MNNDIETKHPVTELGLIHCRECHRDLPLEMFPHKLCPKCGQEKLHSQFYKRPKRPDGLSGWCKSCHLEQVKAYKKAKSLGN
jgi:hypothetical protein